MPRLSPRLSGRAQSLGTENAFVVLAEVNALAREGMDIISFCIGQPDFPAPLHVQEAAIGYIVFALGIAAKAGDSFFRQRRWTRASNR